MATNNTPTKHGLRKKFLEKIFKQILPINFPERIFHGPVKSQQQPTATTTTINEQKEEQTRVEKNLSFYYNIYYIIFTFNVEFYSYNIIWNVDASSPSLSLSCSRSRFSTDFSLANERERERWGEMARQTFRWIKLSAAQQHNNIVSSLCTHSYFLLNFIWILTRTRGEHTEKRNETKRNKGIKLRMLLLVSVHTQKERGRRQRESLTVLVFVLLA